MELAIPSLNLKFLAARAMPLAKSWVEVAWEEVTDTCQLHSRTLANGELSI